MMRAFPSDNQHNLVLTDCRALSVANHQGLGIIEDAVIAIAGDKILWAGKKEDAPTLSKSTTVSLEGRWITPGLIDCHTHLVFGGNRAAEFEKRLMGASYEDIAKQGGGILSTVAATRAATLNELKRSAKIRIQRWLDEGVTTIEIKSGYGLDLENEKKQLQAARALSQELDVTIRTTCLAAHALPPEYKNAQDIYVDLVIDTILPEIAKENLADAVDVFCEKIAFSPSQTRRIFDKAKKLHLAVKLHADQLSDQNGAALAAEYGALSADHLEYTSEEGVKALARAQTIAVLLPSAYYALRETKLPPIAHLRHHHVPIAIASDANPGSSPMLSFLPILNMACILFRLTPEEALLGVTRHAAKALGLEKTHGTIEAGKIADLAIWDIEHPAELSYWIGANPCSGVLYNGRWRKRHF